MIGQIAALLWVLLAAFALGFGYYRRTSCPACFRA